jgi:type VI protein secretion system component Hcp
MGAYVKVPGVQGNSTEVSHLKWIETLSFHWGIGQGLSGGGGGPTPEDRRCDFTMKWHTAAQHLFSLAQSGAIIPEVRVDFTRNTGKSERTFVTCLLHNVHIAQAGGGDPVLVTMEYAQVKSERV